MTPEQKDATIEAIRKKLVEYQEDQDLWRALPEYGSVRLFDSYGGRYFLHRHGFVRKFSYGTFMVDDDDDFESDLEHAATDFYDEIQPEFRTPEAAVALVEKDLRGRVEAFKEYFAARGNNEGYPYGRDARGPFI